MTYSDTQVRDMLAYLVKSLQEVFPNMARERCLPIVDTMSLNDNQRSGGRQLLQNGLEDIFHEMTRLINALPEDYTRDFGKNEETKEDNTNFYG